MVKQTNTSKTVTWLVKVISVNQKWIMGAQWCLTVRRLRSDNEGILYYELGVTV